MSAFIIAWRGEICRAQMNANLGLHIERFGDSTSSRVKETLKTI